MENPGGPLSVLSYPLPVKNNLHPKDFDHSIIMPIFVTCFILVKNHTLN